MRWRDCRTGAPNRKEAFFLFYNPSVSSADSSLYTREPNGEASETRRVTVKKGRRRVLLPLSRARIPGRSSGPFRGPRRAGVAACRDGRRFSSLSFLPRFSLSPPTPSLARGAFFQLSRRRQKNRRIPGPPVFISFRGGDRRSFSFLLSSFFFIRFSADFKDGKFSPTGSAAERRRKSLFISRFLRADFFPHYI